MPDARLFPPIDAYQRGWLPDSQHRERGVGVTHRVAYSQWGNPAGQPVLLFHGGPGSGSGAMQPRLFDPARYRIIQFDQRGCGASLPAGECRANRTRHLLADAERLRNHLGIARWLVVGGSWGATLAACYGAAHRPAVDGIVLRGLFLTGRNDLDWFFGGSAARYPEAWVGFSAALPAGSGKIVERLAKVFADADPATCTRVAQAWWAWEQTLGGALSPQPPTGEALAALIIRYRVQSHYLRRQCWLGEAAVLDACRRLAGLPVVLVHGSQDAICLPRNAELAYRVLPESRMIWAEGAGHDPFHPALIGALQTALGLLPPAA